LAALVVMDSGIALATVLEEPHSEKAQALVASWQRDGLQLAAPTLFGYEVVAVIRKAVWQGRLSSS
jgi:predicted nucleic acid-binding protein